ncbi:hypothetical protein, partial [Streptomyces sp. NPDC049585]|uniref:hypothetical protein n=1 Tax=Streptomyces sp. NPDC049585 TaxID=3155154 RepID=UPI00342C21DA
GTSSIEMDGVSTYLALTFGTLLSSQGTDASFVLTRSVVLLGLSSGRFPSVFPTLPDPFSVPFPVRNSFLAPCWSGVFLAFGLSAPGVITTLADFPPGS